MADLAVYTCPECGGPLPAARADEHVTCTFCGHAVTLATGGPAMERERASRAEAEALFATLGRPPRLTQRIAVVLVNKWLWILGGPFMFAFLVQLAAIPQTAIADWWERHEHSRMVHVVSGPVAWIVDIMFPAGILIALLIWSLFGERVSARRELQAALAAKPPEVAGGPGRCRHCSAELAVPEGALGVRCPACGADNLVRIPDAWAARAKTIEANVRLTAAGARKVAAESRRRIWRAVLWRGPVLLGLFALVGWPAYNARHNAGWRDMHYIPDNGIAIAVLAIHVDGDMPNHALRDLVPCDKPKLPASLRDESTFALTDSKWLDGGAWETDVMLPLARGEQLRLTRATPTPVAYRLALAPRDYLGGVAVLYDGFGDEVATGQPPATIPIEISGWYKLALTGGSDGAVATCVQPAP